MQLLVGLHLPCLVICIPRCARNQQAGLLKPRHCGTQFIPNLGQLFPILHYSEAPQALSTAAVPWSSVLFGAVSILSESILGFSDFQPITCSDRASCLLVLQWKCYDRLTSSRKICPGSACFYLPQFRFCFARCVCYLLWFKINLKMGNETESATSIPYQRTGSVSCWLCKKMKLPYSLAVEMVLGLNCYHMLLFALTEESFLMS